MGLLSKDFPNRANLDDNSEPSGSSTPRYTSGCQKPKKLQFSVVAEVYEIDCRRNSPPVQIEGTEDSPLHVKYYQTAEPQTTVIVNREPLNDSNSLCDSTSVDDIKTSCEDTEEKAHNAGTVAPKKFRNSTESLTGSENSTKTSTSVVNSDKFDPQITSSSTNLLGPKTKECLNLIHNTNFLNNKRVFLLDHKCSELKSRDDQIAKLERKFVVNGYESRPSNNWDQIEKKTLKHTNLELAKIPKIEQDLNDQCLTLENNSQILKEQCQHLELKSLKFDHDYAEKISLLEEMCIHPHVMNEKSAAKYKSLRTARDIECLHMSQASKLMFEICSKDGKKNWVDKLLVEKILLDTSEKLKLIDEKIKNCTIHEELNSASPQLENTIELSEIRFPFAAEPDCPTDKDFIEIFVLVLSCDDQIYTSDYITGETSPVKFEKKFVFRNVPANFEITLKLFCLKQRTSDEYFWEKLKQSNCCECRPKIKIFYENPLTNQYEEESVLITAFKLCAQTCLTCNQIDRPSSSLILIKDVFDKLDGSVEHNIKCGHVKMNTELSCFLDVGRLFEEACIWERQWCVLSEHYIYIYNYPPEQTSGTPVEQINLHYTCGPIITKVPNCHRKRTFQLRIAYPKDNDSEKTFSPNSNYVIKTFYFSCPSEETFEEWTKKMEEIMNTFRSLVDHASSCRTRFM